MKCTIQIGSHQIRCEHGDNLRKVLLAAGFPPHNPAAKHINCHSLGSCGTCAVEIDGAVSPMTRREAFRLSFPPHKKENGLRLACQCKVLGDLVVTKHPGFWGQEVSGKEEA